MDKKIIAAASGYNRPYGRGNARAGGGNQVYFRTQQAWNLPVTLMSSQPSSSIVLTTGFFHEKGAGGLHFIDVADSEIDLTTQPNYGYGYYLFHKGRQDNTLTLSLNGTELTQFKPCNKIEIIMGYEDGAVRNIIIWGAY